MPVDFVVQMFHAIPTMRVVKDEAGDPLERVRPTSARRPTTSWRCLRARA